MPAVNLQTSVPNPSEHDSTSNPLPQLLQTPSGLAIVEIQGTIHGPHTLPSDSPSSNSTVTTRLGRLEFPLYDTQDKSDGKWMKKVYLYIGKHQRLTGEAKKLAKPLGVIQKANSAISDSAMDMNSHLELVEVVKYKLLFSGRPEPVGE
ncbi:uncharacterized protein A1O9_08966 [Exophiala aquamarina CBS 119918]|uniref:Chromosome transmission fidelity protein 8 n=1 Tax=Exophiala aquamarina CBS 119918 TaxID=1182545 RepID=A0A072P6I8_9EURO|nr:uncharacterized protein A1O9_08966 [Exophiala aquamarina CBS 119918]KEF55312.1 hypothetical protein A1O9_08966 [Exophiala aquamarina CBS 119918]